MRAPTAELRVDQLRKEFPGFTLTAEFRVAAGERAALVGRSGSGKSSLLRLLAGLETPDSGRIFSGERDLTRLPARQRGVGMVFQDQALFPALDVLGNAIFGLRAAGVPRAQAEVEGLRWLERVGLAGSARQKVTSLSGGERQRVAFVRAWIRKPEILLLDEPFSALDGPLREELRGHLMELHRGWPVPLLLVSHDVADVEAITNVRLKVEESSDLRTRRIVLV